MIYTAGNHGEGVRSDCYIRLETSPGRGLSVEVKSKVYAMYGESIVRLCHDILHFFDISDVNIEVDDSGALPFVIAARLEAVIKKYNKTDKEYLLPFSEKNRYSTKPDADRVSRLYLPGNNPKLMINAGIYGSNCIILDLEDSVAPDRKHEARFLVRNALRSVDFYGAERMVRINQLPQGLEDLDFCVSHHVNLILIPKCENGSQVKQTNDRISEILGRENDTIHLMPIIESAAGVLHAHEIATGSEHVVALAIGLEDYTADIGTQRTPEGRESLFARSMVVNAARAAGIQPIDSVYSGFDDPEVLASIVKESRALGFEGMGCIHPGQIAIVNRNFLPDDAVIQKACKIVLAFEKAEKEGSAVVSIDSKMVDLPVVKRAVRIIEKAVDSGLLAKDWREGHGG